MASTLAAWLSREENWNLFLKKMKRSFYSVCLRILKCQPSSEDSVWVPMWEGNKQRSHMQSSHPMECICQCTVGSGSLSSPMWEHRNFALFYGISITHFSTVFECILLEFIWIKRTFSSHSYDCFYVCIACASKNRWEVFSVCPVPIRRSETWTKTVDVFIRSVTKPYVLYTAICGIAGSEIECWFKWCKCCGLLNRKTPSNV